MHKKDMFIVQTDKLYCFLKTFTHFELDFCTMLQ